jgi:hypothetical protein
MTETSEAAETSEERLHASGKDDDDPDAPPVDDDGYAPPADEDTANAGAQSQPSPPQHECC